MERFRSRFCTLDRIQLVILLAALLLVVILLVERTNLITQRQHVPTHDWLSVKLHNVTRPDAKTADVIIRLRTLNVSDGKNAKLLPFFIRDILARRLGINERVNINLEYESSRNILSNTRTINRSVGPTKPTFPLTINTEYVINNKDICSGKIGRLFLIIVHTAPSHFGRRRWLRETWANKNAYRDVTVRVAFLFGKPDTQDTQILIENESLVYRDVIQGRFKDSYKNLTHKGVLGLRWTAENCKQADFVIKVDDDVYVNMFEVIGNIFQHYGSKPRHFMCQVRREGLSKIQRGSGKWAVDESEFRNSTFYPTYCNGYAVFMTADVIAPLFHVAASTPFFWIDDVYLFGLLPQKIGGFTWINLRDNFTLHTKVGLESYTDRKPTRYIVSSAFQRDVIEQMWFSTLRKLPVTSRTYVKPMLLQSVEDAVRAETIAVTTKATKPLSKAPKVAQKTTGKIVKPKS